jgi:acetylornithine deacetylase/succinyl-diaminopimelate desuccinylase-like protein
MNKRTLTLCVTILLGLVFSVGLVSACQEQPEYRDTQPVSIQELSQTTAISPTQVVWEMLGQVNQDRALGDLRRLTGEEPICANSECYTIANRLTGSEGLHWATDYISKELVSLGYSVEFRDWSRSGRADRNLIARKSGVYSPTEEVYFVAHADGVKPSADERFPAADDDASGAVDNLELARILSSHTFSRTVVLLFTTGEEQGTLGVRSYLDQLSPPELGAIKYAVNVDMVGYDANRDGVMELWHGGHAPSMAVTQMMSETIRAYQLDLVPRFVVGCG